MQPLRIVVLAGVGVLLVTSLAIANPGPRQRVADPYAGYAAHTYQPLARDAQVVSRGAIVVERDRDRVTVERTTAQRVSPASQVRVVTNPRYHVPAPRPVGLEQPHAAGPHPQAPALLNGHTNPAFANSPPPTFSELDGHSHAQHTSVQHHHHVYHHHHYHPTPVRRSYVYHTPQFCPTTQVIVTQRPHFHHRPHRIDHAPRLHTAVHLRYHGSHVGVHYRHGISSSKFRHHRHHHHRHHSTGIRLHLRF